MNEMTLEQALNNLIVASELVPLPKAEHVKLEKSAKIVKEALLKLDTSKEQ